MYPVGLYRGQNFNLLLHLHLYFVNASSKGSGESAYLRRLARAFAAGQCDNYYFLVLTHLYYLVIEKKEKKNVLPYNNKS